MLMPMIMEAVVMMMMMKEKNESVEELIGNVLEIDRTLNEALFIQFVVVDCCR
jgi:hypothetical protein